MEPPARTTVIRLSASVVLACLAVALFILNREEQVKAPQELQREFLVSARAIDKGVDDILDRFGVEKTWIRKKQLTADERFTRVERRVVIPPSIIPAMVNREMNLLAHRFQGRAVATENLRENTVTIQIILDRSVIQTVILKIDQNIQPKDAREQSKEI